MSSAGLDHLLTALTGQICYIAAVGHIFNLLLYLSAHMTSTH